MKEHNEYTQPLTQFEQDFESGNKNLFLEIRDIIINYTQMTELQKTIVTTFANSDGPICNMRTYGKFVEITFLKGIRMKDKYKLLTGSGKEMRSISISEFNEELIRYYVGQAVTINSKRKK